MKRTPSRSCLEAVGDSRQKNEVGIIALRYASDTYRVVTAVQLGPRIYVLHAFQKKSKRGIETPKREVDVIRKRYAEAQELARDYEKTKIN